MALLYYQGCWNLAASPSVAVVGTRRPLPQGLARTRRLVWALVADGYTVVSGLAVGVDRAAHEAAIQAGGRTIAALGMPLSDALKGWMTTLVSTHRTIRPRPKPATQLVALAQSTSSTNIGPFAEAATAASCDAKADVAHSLPLGVTLGSQHGSERLTIFQLPQRLGLSAHDGKVTGRQGAKTHQRPRCVKRKEALESPRYLVRRQIIQDDLEYETPQGCPV